MNRLDRNPNDPPTPREIRARRIGAVALVFSTVGMVIAVLLLAFARWIIAVDGPNAEVFRGLGIALISLAVLMVSFVAIVLAVALDNVVVRRIGTVIAVVATISGAAALLGY
ncbi:hypothetical protein ACQUSY_10045 [Microbacterium sp. YY-03]|uniref:hypothetical protein n=1 Tax=Microbacterium sp. YY-03 TaxID=3421636 RepID=UPI003D16CC71